MKKLFTFLLLSLTLTLGYQLLGRLSVMRLELG